MKKLMMIALLLLLQQTLVSAQQAVAAKVVTGIQTNIQRQLKRSGDDFLPKSTKIDKIVLTGERADIYLALPQDFLNKLTDVQFDEIMELALPFFSELNASAYFFFAKDKSGKYEPLERFLPQIDVPQEYNNTMNANIDPDKNPSLVSRNLPPPPKLPKQKTGALEGKTVWLSPGHGWQWQAGDWRTQRGNTLGIVEDFSNIEAVNYTLLHYLEQAGANVWSVRERDMNPNEVIVDDEDKGFSVEGNWTKSIADGYKKTYMYIYTQPTETARATFTPTIPESGYYWVSVYFRDGNNRCSDARYHIHHAGGESVVSINQKVHGLTWVYLGQYYFEKGTKGKVVLSGLSADVGSAVVADAVRFGGGMGTVPANGRLSGKPRYEEAALYYADYQGFRGRNDDVTVRPEYAEWELAKGTEDERKNAIYVSWHTNAGGGRGRGTESFIHNSAAVKGSTELSKFVHDELVNDIRGEFDPNWRDRGVKRANFGELRRLRTMPSTLIEVGFHDNVDDATAILTPKFRDLSARAVYQGIVRYYAALEGKAPVFLPEKPTHLAARNIGNNRIQLTWRAPLVTPTGGHAATGYKVYISKHGKAFTDGVTVRSATHTFDNLESGTTYYFKVTAINDGGESFRTPIVTARTPKAGSTTVPFLIVDGFHRLDRAAAVSQDDGRYLGTTQRLFLDRMNRYDYTVEHAKGLEAAGISFDGASNEAVRDLMINVTTYKGISWLLGEESTVDVSLDVNERTVIRRYLQQGGTLLISGSEHAFDMGRKGGSDPWFFSNFLKSDYADDHARTYKFKGATNSFLSDLQGNFDNGTAGLYDVNFPDVLSPKGGSLPLLTYEGGKGGAAAVAYEGTDFKVVNFGFPVETVTDEKVRNEIIARTARFLLGELKLTPVKK